MNTSNLKIRNYETNKRTDFFVNNLNWKSNKNINKFGAEAYFEAILKGINYEAKNTSEYKNDNFNTELKSSLGYFAKLDLFKKELKNNFFKTLTPKFLFRYAPGNMKKIDSQRLTYDNLFSLNKINELDTIENGLSTSVGFDYKINKFNKNNSIGDDVFSFSAGQVISEKENKKMPSNSSLDQRFSDVVGKATYNINNKLDVNYNFSLDQNYKEFNYNEIGTNYYMDDKVKFNFSYLQEKNHIGNQEFVSSGIDYKINDSAELSFSTKRNLLTNSAEFYNLSYNYINDCLKAGIAYRREFYTDRDIEPNNTLMFTISIIPFAEINSPSISR
jgi:LPS-assembly protein